MIAILAPSKTMDFQSDYIGLPDESAPLFKDKTKYLIELLRTKPVEELMELMKISKTLAEENHNRFREFSSGKDSERQRQTIFALQGDVYKGLDARSFTKEELFRAEDSIRILSGLYGILSPLTLIEPYRLEMGLKLEEQKMSGFWKSSVTEELNLLLAKRQDKTIIDLASAEYMAAVDKKKLKGEIIDIVFRENRDGKLKTIAVFSKRARGLMARYIVKEQIKTPEGLKNFNDGGYIYDKSISTGNSFVFVR